MKPTPVRRYAAAYDLAGAVLTCPTLYVYIFWHINIVYIVNERLTFTYNDGVTT